MSDVKKLDDYRPHFTVKDHSGACHVIPVSFFRNVARGKAKLSDMDHGDAIARVIVAEWLAEIHMVGGDELLEIEE